LETLAFLILDLFRIFCALFRISAFVRQEIMHGHLITSRGPPSRQAPWGLTLGELPYHEAHVYQSRKVPSGRRDLLWQCCPRANVKRG